MPFLQKIHESITSYIVVRKVIDPEFIELRECLRIYKENHETGLSFTIPNFIFLLHSFIFRAFQIFTALSAPFCAPFLLQLSQYTVLSLVFQVARKLPTTDIFRNCARDNQSCENEFHFILIKRHRLAISTNLICRFSSPRNRSVFYH